MEKAEFSNAMRVWENAMRAYAQNIFASVANYAESKPGVEVLAIFLDDNNGERISFRVLIKDRDGLLHEIAHKHNVNIADHSFGEEWLRYAGIELVQLINGKRVFDILVSNNIEIIGK